MRFRDFCRDTAIVAGLLVYGTTGISYTRAYTKTMSEIRSADATVHIPAMPATNGNWMQYDIGAFDYNKDGNCDRIVALLTGVVADLGPPIFIRKEMRRGDKEFDYYERMLFESKREQQNIIHRNDFAAD